MKIANSRLSLMTRFVASMWEGGCRATELRPTLSVVYGGPKTALRVLHRVFGALAQDVCSSNPYWPQVVIPKD